MIEFVAATLRARDGVELAASWLTPPAPALTVVLHPATAVPARYYAPFAEWLAVHAQARVLTYDYRECGRSHRQAPGRAERGPGRADMGPGRAERGPGRADMGPGRADMGPGRADMGQWLTLDQDAALSAAVAAAGDGPVEVVGHSLGGLGAMFHRDAARVRRLVAVASGPAYWRAHSLRETPRVLAFWFLIGPAAAGLFGHVPRQLTGFGAHVSRAAFLQWRRWCVQPHFHRVDWGGALPQPDLDAFAGRLRMVASADDGLIPPERARRLAEFYPAATCEFAVLRPADVGGASIGHAGMFRASRRALWPLIWGA